MRPRRFLIHVRNRLHSDKKCAIALDPGIFVLKTKCDPKSFPNKFQVFSKLFNIYTESPRTTGVFPDMFPNPRKIYPDQNIPDSTPNQRTYFPESINNSPARPRIDSKTYPNRPRVDPTTIPNRPKCCGSCFFLTLRTNGDHVESDSCFLNQGFLNHMGGGTVLPHLKKVFRMGERLAVFVHYLSCYEYHHYYHYPCYHVSSSSYCHSSQYYCCNYS